MQGLIRFSLNNWYAVIVFVLTILVLGVLSFFSTPIDILPINPSPAVQILTFNNGMPATNIEKNISSRLERWTGQAAGTAKQESRSIIGASVVRNYYRDNVDPNGALTQVASLASSAVPYLPPGTLPPVVLPFDPTSSTPVCLVALDSTKYGEKILYDTGRYEVRNMIMNIPGAVAPVVYGGKVRAIICYLNREQMQARSLSPNDLLNALENYNIFLPTGSVKVGRYDYAWDSNSLYNVVKRMKGIPVKSENGRTIFLGEVAEPEDSSFIQTNVVRVNGRKQVYVPVYRQQGASTLSVVENLEEALPDIQNKLTHQGIHLRKVMDQSVYVRRSIESLAEEGVLGALLCAAVILLFLGEWRMTVIAILTIPISVLGALVCLNLTGNTINVMTLAGLSLAIGPLVDSAIICLENTHRHLGLGVKPREAALFGAAEVALPELVATCCTLLVLSPLALMSGLGRFLFRPMALAVAFAMITAYILSRSFVPVLCALFLRSHGPQARVYHGADFEHRSEHELGAAKGPFTQLFERWEGVINAAIRGYVWLLERVMRRRVVVLVVAAALLVGVVVGLGPRLRREFFPEVDAGAFEIYVRARDTGLRIEETQKRIVAVEQAVEGILGADREMTISEIGVVADWSAAYTPNAGPMDTVIRIQLKEDRQHSAQEYVHLLREQVANAEEFRDLEFSFNAGGMIGAAMNEGKPTPINVQIVAKDLRAAAEVATAIEAQVKYVPGVVDCHILQRQNYPQFIVDVDRAKASSLGLTQADVMKNLISALNSSIQFNKRIFWIDPANHNQYYVGVQYREEDIQSLDTIRNIPINSPTRKEGIPLGNVAHIRTTTVPAEINHTNLQATVDLTMGVYGRDLGHVADNVARIVKKFGAPKGPAQWVPYDPEEMVKGNKVPLEGSLIRLTGEYTRMQETFWNLGIGLLLAALLVYFLMVALFKSWLTPLVILSAVPVGLIGVVLMLFVTGTAINVQSLLGVIFMVGIVVSNTVLLIDFAQHLRRAHGLSPTESIIRAASLRVRPVVMTALAAFCALVPMALALSRGSEANAPLGRAVIGGLLAGLVTTLFVVPSLYSLVVPGAKTTPEPAGPMAPAASPVGAS